MSLSSSPKKSVTPGNGFWSPEELQAAFSSHLKYSSAKDQYSATPLDLYNCLSLAVRDHLVEKWIETQQSFYHKDVKRVYYLSMEYLVGRALTNAMVNLDIRGECAEAMRRLGFRLEDMEDSDVEPGLGNGGLGRLASCFLDSMATLALPAYGYGIRYEFGIFYQRIINGHQVETADNWNRRGNPWELPRPEFLYPVKFYGKVVQGKGFDGQPVFEWVDTHDDVMAMAYDIPIPGYKNGIVNNLRLWSARTTREMDFELFNVGDYIQSVRRKQESEVISKVLYPNDNIVQGKELRLKQEYFFVSASLQDIVRRHLKSNPNFDNFSDKVAIQLNDTHPALAIAELMRILIDQEKVPWRKAWDITCKTFAYTNHTVLPEALEKWPVDLLGHILPRHLQIIYEINHQFLDEVKKKHPRLEGSIGRLSIIEEGPTRFVRMANLAVVGSHSVNGVARLHSDILKTGLFREFHEIYPDRFNNKTNGITQRLWLKSCNPDLAGLITETIGEGWLTRLDEMQKLIPHAGDAAFRNRWMQIKRDNKKKLADFILKTLNVRVPPDSLFDIQVKRMHEYKRQHLNLLGIVLHYLRIKNAPKRSYTPRTAIFSGKAAPGYRMAKLIIKLINSVAETVNNDREIGDRLKVVFIPNYCVSMAERIIPAADLSQQISTAGMEASGTGNMKLSLNGALTIGTLDGANIEIMEEVGRENIFIFGLNAEEVNELNRKGYHPRQYYDAQPELRLALDALRSGRFSPNEPDLFHPLVDNLIHHDPFKVLADFSAYCKSRDGVDDEFKNTESWARKSIINSARMGKFSSDRTIAEYAKEIWNVKPVK